MSEFASASSLERVPVSEWTLRFAMKCCLRECFGDYFKRDEEIVRMKDNFDFVSKLPYPPVHKTHLFVPKKNSKSGGASCTWV